MQLNGLWNVFFLQCFAILQLVAMLVSARLLPRGASKNGVFVNYPRFSARLSHNSGKMLLGFITITQMICTESVALRCNDKEPDQSVSRVTYQNKYQILYGS